MRHAAPIDRHELSPGSYDAARHDAGFPTQVRRTEFTASSASSAVSNTVRAKRRLVEALFLDDGVRIAGGLAIALVAGILKGAIGFGFPVVAVPLLAFLFDTRTAVVVVPLPLVLTNIFILTRAPAEQGLLRRLMPLIVCFAPFSVLGAYLLSRVSAPLLTSFLGVVVCSLGILSLLNPKLTIPRHLELRTSIVLGVVSGVLNGIASLGGPLFALYLNGIRLDKWSFVWGITLIFLVANAIQIASYTQFGMLVGNALLFSIAMIPLAWIGQWLGLFIHDRLDQSVFRRIVLTVVILSGATLVLKGLQAG